MSFHGWPVEALEFYEGLEADNSKVFWTEHRQVYEQTVRAPMEQLLAELADEFGEGKIFRPYRDVRFSRDKTPYKTVLGAALGTSGYIQLSAAGLAAGNGMYTMAPDQVTRFREAVADDLIGPRLGAAVAEIERQGIRIDGHWQLKTTPRGYPADHPRIELLRYKGITAWREWPADAWLGTAEAKQRVVDFLRASQPLKEWLDRHVGPTSIVATRT